MGHPVAYSVINVKLLVGTFNQEKALLETFFVIVTYSQTFSSSNTCPILMSRHARCSEEGWQWAEGCGCLLLDPPPRTGGEGVSAVSAGLVNLVLVPVSLSMYVRKVEVD